MSISRPLCIALMTALLLSPVVRAQPQDSNGGQACFFSRDFQQWRSPDPNTIYIRVGVNRFYRLDLSAPCPPLQFPDVHLVSVFHGSDTICAPIDWDLRVSQFPQGITEQCIVKSMTRLTPEQVSAIPSRFRP
jgi:hypothetical protein